MLAFILAASLAWRGSVAQEPAEPAQAEPGDSPAGPSSPAGEQASPAPAAGDQPSGLAALVALEELLTATIARCEPSVVSIARVKKQDRSDADFGAFPNLFDRSDQPPVNDGPSSPDFIPNEYSTGVVIDKGLILTTFHIVEDGNESEYWVTGIDRRPHRAEVVATTMSYKGTIVGSSRRADLAILKVSAPELVPIVLGDAKTLKKGQIVISLGNPYAIARDGQASAAWGIVSNLSRKAGPHRVEDPRSQPEKPTLHHFGTLIQTDAKLNWGTSGGPLLNLKGEMVGLTVSYAALDGYEQAAGYAIPIDDDFRRIIDDLKAGREVEFGFLGVQPRNLTEDELAAGPLGAVIHQVVPGSPAERFGIEPGDLITAVDGEPVYDIDGLMLQIGKRPVEAIARLTVQRGDERNILTVDVEVAKLGVPDGGIVTSPAPTWRGAHVDWATVLATNVAWQEAHLTAPIQVAMRQGCVAVVAVAPDSAAFAAGLRYGTLISHVGTTPVQTPAEFFRAVAGATGPIHIRLAAGIGPATIVTVGPEVPPPSGAEPSPASD
jgi:serine protease Do